MLSTEFCRPENEEQAAHTHKNAFEFAGAQRMWLRNIKWNGAHRCESWIFYSVEHASVLRGRHIAIIIIITSNVVVPSHLIRTSPRPFYQHRMLRYTQHVGIYSRCILKRCRNHDDCNAVTIRSTARMTPQKRNVCRWHLHNHGPLFSDGPLRCSTQNPFSRWNKQNKK